MDRCTPVAMVEHDVKHTAALTLCCGVGWPAAPAAAALVLRRRRPAGHGCGRRAAAAAAVRPLLAAWRGAGQDVTVFMAAWAAGPVQQSSVSAAGVWSRGSSARGGACSRNYNRIEACNSQH